jgi:hypothetical protein
MKHTRNFNRRRRTMPTLIRGSVKIHYEVYGMCVTDCSLARDALPEEDSPHEDLQEPVRVLHRAIVSKASSAMWKFVQIEKFLCLVTI